MERKATRKILYEKKPIDYKQSFAFNLSYARLVRTT